MFAYIPGCISDFLKTFFIPPFSVFYFIILVHFFIIYPAEENFRTESERNQDGANTDDRIYPTGWEDSRRIFEQHLEERSTTGVSDIRNGEEVDTPDNSKMDSNNHTVLGSINSLAESLSRIIDDDSGG